MWCTRDFLLDHCIIFHVSFSVATVLHIHVLLLYIILTDSGFEANSFSILGLIQLDDSVEPAPSSAPPSGDPPSGMYACTKWMAPWWVTPGWIGAVRPSVHYYKFHQCSNTTSLTLSLENVQEPSTSSASTTAWCHHSRFSAVRRRAPKVHSLLRGPEVRLPPGRQSYLVARWLGLGGRPGQRTGLDWRLVWR